MSLKTIEGTIIAIDRLRKKLGSRKTYPRENLLFIEPKQHGAFRPAMQVRANAFSEGKKDPDSNPLFRGNLRFFNQGSVQDKAFLLSFYLDANLSLLARMQGTPRDLNSLTFCGATAPPCSDGEYSLDGKENWILDGKQDALFSPERWGKFTQDAVEGIRKRVVDAITEARNSIADEVLFSGEQEAKLSPEYLETYWEFFHENPVALVDGFTSPLMDFAKSVRLTSFRKEHTFSGHTLSLEIKSGTYLRIYAKTNKRLRFEVVHDLSKNSRLLQRKDPKTSKTTQARKVSTVEELCVLLDILRNDAAKIVNRALDHLRRKFQVIPSGISLLDLIVRISQAVHTPRKKGSLKLRSEKEKQREREKITREFLEILRVRGCIPSENFPKELRPVLDALKKAGFLRCEGGGGRIYRIFPEGEHALHNLMRVPNSPLIPIEGKTEEK